MDILVDSMRSGVKFCVGWWSREVERTILDPFRENSIFDPDWFRSARNFGSHLGHQNHHVLMFQSRFEPQECLGWVRHVFFIHIGTPKMLRDPPGSPYTRYLQILVPEHIDVLLHFRALGGVNRHFNAFQSIRNKKLCRFINSKCQTDDSGPIS